MDASDSNWPQRVDHAQRVVDATVRALPEDVRECAERLVLVLEAVPSENLVEEGIASDSLGLFSGQALRDPLGNDLTEPTVTLYLDNLWDFAEGSWRVFREEVRTTYLHELGHYLGLDEDDLADRDLD